MKYKYIQIGIFLFLGQLGLTQDTYSTNQLQDFVTIYMDAKKINTSENKVLTVNAKLTEYAISHERYKEIFHSNLQSNDVNLSSSEISFFDEMQKLDKEIKQEKEKSILRLCTDKSLDYETFNSIRQKYKSDIKFQRSLKPYFDQYFKARK
ncbi:MAG: hypothetical protein ACI86M_003672 [Saprospiraceae bacterium]|jgi:hypothetical protein